MLHQAGRAAGGEQHGKVIDYQKAIYIDLRSSNQLPHVDYVVTHMLSLWENRAGHTPLVRATTRPGGAAGDSGALLISAHL